jgi:hypothetical protein
MKLRADGKMQRLCIALTLVCSCAAQRTHTDAPSLLEREGLRLAEKAVLVSLVVGASVEGNTLCAEKPAACMGPGRTELAISLIGARSTPASLRALARLIRYRLDGAYYEQYGEEVADKGGRIQPYLAALSPKELRDNCHNDVSSFIRSSGSVIRQVREEEVCRTEQEIADELSRLLPARMRSH